MTETIWLQRPNADVPWGFRLQGGRDTGNPLTVHRVTSGSIAATGLAVGDIILQIGHTSTHCLTQHEAQELIKNCGNLMQIIITRGGRGDTTEKQFQDMNLREEKIHRSTSQMDSRVPPGAPADKYVMPSIQNMPPPVPDAVLNMAARQGSEDKKPWAYAPDMASIQEQRNKVRKRQPVAAIPHYQNILNMPSFDDKPIKVTKAGEMSDSAHSNGDNEYTCVMAEKYNNPLGLYTEDNVREALSGQTQGRFTDIKRLPNKDEKDITQSAVYKMIHGLDEPKTKSKTYSKEGHDHSLHGPSADDELRFSGMIPPSEIPSRSFHMLQDMTSHSEIDETSIRPTFGEDAGDVGQYDEQSIRYRGCNIPSKSFRMLQSMTGGHKDTPVDAVTVATERRKMRRQRSHDVDPGGPGAPQGMKMDDRSVSHAASNISKSWAPGSPPIQTDIIVKASKPTVLKLHQKTVLAPKPAQIAEFEDCSGFDESAYLAGHIAILSGERHARNLPAVESCESTIDKNTEEVDYKQPFDEDAYMSGKLNILGRPRPVEIKPKEKETLFTEVPWLQRSQNVKCSEFTEQEFLRGRYPLMKGHSSENLLQPVPVSLFTIKSNEPVETTSESQHVEQEKNFSEEDYLAGKVSILGAGDRKLGAPRGIRKEVREQPAWIKDEDEMFTDDEFDEDAFLKGEMNRNNTMLQRSVSESMMYRDIERERAIWEVAPGGQTEGENMSDGEFDETAYLSGKSIFRRTSLDTYMPEDNSKLPTRAFMLLKRSTSHDNSPLTSTENLEQHEDSEEQGSQDPNKAYNEMVYIGKKIPSKTFARLQKCMGRTRPLMVADPLDRLRNQGSIDVEDAVDVIKIDKHKPEEYFSKLKESIEQDNFIKVEAEDEVTDF